MWTLKTKNGEIMMEQEAIVLEKISKYSKITWWILIILWLVGIILPYFMALSTLVFVAYLMIFAWLVIEYFTFITNKEDWLGYLKWFVLFLAWIFIVVKPDLWIKVLWIVFIIYFFIDGFISLMLSIAGRFKNGSWMWFINYVALFILAVIFIYSWNNVQLLTELIWIFVWISLFFDGVSLLITGRLFKKLLK